MDARWILLLFSHKTGSGGLNYPAYPCLPREGSRGRISQAKNPKEATFIISAPGSHLQYVFSVLLQPHSPQYIYTYCRKRGGAGERGIWALVPCELHLDSPRKHQIQNPTRRSLQRLAFSLMSSHHILYTLQQGASPMPSDLQ